MFNKHFLSFIFAFFSETQSPGLQDRPQHRPRYAIQDRHRCQQRMHRKHRLPPDARMGRNQLQTGTPTDYKTMRGQRVPAPRVANETEIRSHIRPRRRENNKEQFSDKGGRFEGGGDERGPGDGRGVDEGRVQGLGCDDARSVERGCESRPVQGGDIPWRVQLCW